MVTGNPWADEAAEQSAKPRTAAGRPTAVDGECQSGIAGIVGVRSGFALLGQLVPGAAGLVHDRLCPGAERIPLLRSEEHTSELQSLRRISYAVFCLKKKKQDRTKQNVTATTQNEALKA